MRSAAHPRVPAVGVGVLPARTDRNRLTTAFRPILAIPHILLVGGPVAFAISRVGSVLTQWGASTGVLQWSTRVEAYLLLPYDDYPPFSLT